MLPPDLGDPRFPADSIEGQAFAAPIEIPLNYPIKRAVPSGEFILARYDESDSRGIERRRNQNKTG